MELRDLISEIEKYMEKEGLTDSDSIYDLLLSIGDQIAFEEMVDEVKKNLKEKKHRHIPAGKYNKKPTRLGEIKEEDNE